MPSLGVCVRCGREAPLVDGRLCPNCFLEVKGVGRLPEKLVVTRCPRCGSVRLHGRWLPMQTSSLDEIVSLVITESLKPYEEVEKAELVKTSIVSDPVSGLKAVVEFRVRFRGVEGEYTYSQILPVQVRHQLCPTCFRRAAGAAQAVVQVRGWGGFLKPSEREMVRRVIESIPSVQDALLDVEERREGLDIKLLDHAAARLLASKLRSQLGARVIESHKVVGRRSDGKPRSKLTVSVRLPFFRPGEYVVIGGRLAYVEAIRGGRVVYRYAGSSRRHSIGVDQAWDAIKPVPEENVFKGIVTVIEPRWLHVQVLEPVVEYLELPRQKTVVEGRIGVGEKVVVVQLGGRSYVVAENMFKPSLMR